MNSDKRIDNVWDIVAPNFGKVGPKYWEEFGKRLIGFSSINRGAYVLDIGMGRGASLFPAIDKVGKEGYVIGIDNSEVMVKETLKDLTDRNIHNAKVKVMNAQYLDFEENHFDNIICGFGIGYLLASEEKLNCILRVLKNGGQAGFSIWGIQEDQRWLTEIVNKYLPPIKQNKNSRKTDIPSFNTVEGITKILDDAGFINLKIQQEKSVVIYKDKEEWWQEMCTNAVRGIFENIKELGCDVFDAFKNDVFEGLENFNKDNRIHINMPVIYAFGEK